MRYFEVKDESFAEKVQDLALRRQEIGEQYAALARSYGAQSVHTWQHDGSFAGFVFAISVTVDTKIFRPVGGMWVPRRNTKEGKAAWMLIKELPKPVSPNDVLAEYGIDWSKGVYDKETKLNSYACVVGSFETGQLFVKVPSRHFSDSRMESMEVLADGDEKILSSLVWQPPAAWLELSETQFVLKWDELVSNADSPQVT